MSYNELLSSLFALVEGLQNILTDTRFSDSARVEAALRIIATAQAPAPETSAPKPASMAAAAGGGGGGGSSEEPHKSSTDPKPIFSYAGTMASGANPPPKPTPTRRPDQPPAPKQKSKKEDKGIPAHYPPRIQKVLSKFNTEEGIRTVTREDIGQLWGFITNGTPEKIRFLLPKEGSYDSTLKYGAVFKPRYETEHPPLYHWHLTDEVYGHPEKCMREAIARVYDEHGNCRLFKGDDEDSE